jgi:hypothetical protein
MQHSFTCRQVPEPDAACRPLIPEWITYQNTTHRKRNKDRTEHVQRGSKVSKCWIWLPKLHVQLFTGLFAFHAKTITCRDDLGMQHCVVLDFNSWVLGHEKPIFNAQPLAPGTPEDVKHTAFKSQLERSLRTFIARWVQL